MKNFTFLLSLLFLMSSIAINAQVEFCPDGSKWTNTFTATDGSSGKLIYTYVSDTIIQGIECKVIETKKVTEITTLGDYRFIYQDGFKVYLYHSLSDQFVDLYDFGLSEGDKLHVYNTGTFPLQNLITIVAETNSTVQYGEASLRRFSTNQFCSIKQPFAYTELFGSIKGGLFYTDEICTESANIELTCYESETFQYSFNPSQCELSTSTNELPVQQVSMFPNPVTSCLNIDIVPSRVIIYNMKGQEVCIPIPANSKQIDFRPLSSGMYFVRIITDDGNTIMKPVLKQE